jgi:hypothetical protein
VAQIPTDIAKLESLYADGESDDKLCAQAVIIAVRLRNENAFARARMDYARMQELMLETEYFKQLLCRIRGRSTAHDVLSRYDNFLTQQKIVL